MTIKLLSSVPDLPLNIVGLMKAQMTEQARDVALEALLDTAVKYAVHTQYGPYIRAAQVILAIIKEYRENKEPHALAKIEEALHEENLLDKDVLNDE